MERDSWLFPKESARNRGRTSDDLTDRVLEMLASGQIQGTKHSVWYRIFGNFGFGVLLQDPIGHIATPSLFKDNFPAPESLRSQLNTVTVYDWHTNICFSLQETRILTDFGRIYR